MHKSLALGYVLAVLITCSAWAGENVRLTVAAGPLYPEDPVKLRRAMERFDAAANAPEPHARLVACIVPHDGYGLSGDIAAYAFKHLKPGQYNKVIVLGPSHFIGFEGCSIPAVDAYVTPLGLVPISKDVGLLTRLPLIYARGVRYGKTTKEYKPLHEREYSIEMVLPFLQEKLGMFDLVPLAVGDLLDTEGKFDPDRAGAIAEHLSKIMDDKTLVVVSTNFTHYGNDFSFYPFAEQVQERIARLDEEAIGYLLKKDKEGLQNFLEETKVPICGAGALQILLGLLPQTAEGILLARDTSGRKTKAETRSISYAAINFYDTSRPPMPEDPNSPRLPSIEKMAQQLQENREAAPAREEQKDSPLPADAQDLQPSATVESGKRLMDSGTDSSRKTKTAEEHGPARVRGHE